MNALAGPGEPILKLPAASAGPLLQQGFKQVYLGQ